MIITISLFFFLMLLFILFHLFCTVCYIVCMCVKTHHWWCVLKNLFLRHILLLSVRDLSKSWCGLHVLHCKKKIMVALILVYHDSVTFLIIVIHPPPLETLEEKRTFHEVRSSSRDDFIWCGRSCSSFQSLCVCVCVCCVQHIEKGAGFVSRFSALFVCV